MKFYTLVSIRRSLLIFSLVVTGTGAAAPLELPPFSGTPRPGKRCLLSAPEYNATKVRHLVYLPPDWQPGGRIPVIVEYTGNEAPALGSTGRIEDAALGYGVSRGRCIWIVLPYISKDGEEHETRWWGDVPATVRYAKVNVPRLVEEFGGDPEAVLLCGFSRGAIAVNFLGLHDDQIAQLWCAFLTHDHYDGVREWPGTSWGSPLESYRAEAAVRLARIGERPVMVCQNPTTAATRGYLRERISLDRFTFVDVPATEIFGSFPNGVAANPHTDRWLLVESEARHAVESWFRGVVGLGQDSVQPP